MDEYRLVTFKIYGVDGDTCQGHVLCYRPLVVKKKNAMFLF